MADKLNKQYFEHLDTLRFFAFFSVFLTHTFHSSQIREVFSENIILREILLFVSDGGEGVSFFFVLSGFLITYLLLLEKNQNNKISFYNFYLRRVLRIFPLYYAVILFGFVIYPFLKIQLGIETEQNHDWRYHVVFLSNIDLIRIYHSNSSDILMLVINWSLSVEEQFYVVLPLLLAVVWRRFYLVLFSSFIVSSLVFRYLNIQDNMTLSYHTFAVMGDLAVGGLIAYAVIHLQVNNFFSKLSRSTIFIIYTVGLLWVIFDNVLFPFKEYEIFSRLIHTMFYAFIILEQNYALNSVFKLGKLKIISTLGKYTYGLYLLHPIGIQIWIVLLVKRLGWNISNLDVYQLSFAILSFVSTLALAFTSYFILEKPFLKLKDKFSVVK